MTLALPDGAARLLAGGEGEAAAMAMRLVADTARLLGAETLVAVESAHIDGALYHGDSGTLFAEKLVEGRAKVRVPATLNVGGLDLACGAPIRLDPHRRDMAKRLMVAYEAMGCQPSWTCAPYQAGHRPALGTQVAWGESNAVAFVNSVLGARTNRYGDFLDIACALTGYAPFTGLHRTENRRATLVFDTSGISDRLKRSDVFWPVMGALHGRLSGNAIAAVTGLAGCATEDRLKAYGAAAASTGAVGLFHLVGITPEAPDLATVTGGRAPAETLAVTPAMLAEAAASLSTGSGERVDAVAIGSPHCSSEELRELAARFAGRRSRVPFYACTGRHAVAAIAADGTRESLRDAGVTLVADTCVVVTPILAAIDGVLMTNSGKFAHYAPGNTGYSVLYASLEECVESAVAGRALRDGARWQ